MGVTSIIERARKGGSAVRYRIRVVSIGRPISSNAVRAGRQVSRGKEGGKRVEEDGPSRRAVASRLMSARRERSEPSLLGRESMKRTGVVHLAAREGNCRPRETVSTARESSRAEGRADLVQAAHGREVSASSSGESISETGTHVGAQSLAAGREDHVEVVAGTARGGRPGQLVLAPRSSRRRRRLGRE